MPSIDSTMCRGTTSITNAPFVVRQTRITVSDYQAGLTIGLRLSSHTSPAEEGGAFLLVEAHPSPPNESPQALGALWGFLL
jgi:hypothetical protein